MTALYDTRLVIASLKNVPSQGYDVAHANGVRIFKQHPEILIVTETWDPAVKRGLRNAAPDDWDWWTIDGQSVMIGWGGPWGRAIPSSVRGGSSGRIPFVTDRRDLIGVNLRRDDGLRRLVPYGVHTAPIPTKKAPIKVPLARASHRAAARRMNRMQRRIGYPMLFAGDFNTDELLDPDLRIGPGITHAECFHGANAEFRRGGCDTFGLASDHPGVTIDLRLIA